MLTAIRRMSKLESNGCRFRLDNSEIAVVAPKGTLSEEDRTVIRAHRDDIATMLTARTILSAAITQADAILTGWHRTDRATTIRDTARSLVTNVETDLATAIDSHDQPSVESMMSQVRFVARRIVEHTSESVTLQGWPCGNLRFD
mgnify:CR=1 FL=1